MQLNVPKINAMECRTQIIYMDEFATVPLRYHCCWYEIEYLCVYLCISHIPTPYADDFQMHFEIYVLAHTNIHTHIQLDTRRTERTRKTRCDTKL